MILFVFSLLDGYLRQQHELKQGNLRTIIEENAGGL